MNRRIDLVLAIILAVVLGSATAQARYLNPNTGRFLTMDSYEGNTEDPNTLHKYVYAEDDPVNGIDPSGLRTFLLLYGDNKAPNNPPIFENSANYYSTVIRTWRLPLLDEMEPYDESSDDVVVAPAFDITQMVTALNNNKDIAFIAYFGHGGPGALYLGLPKGAKYNLSPYGGAAGDASDSTPIALLPVGNVRADAKILLASCVGTKVPLGQHQTPMSRAFTDHFKVPVMAAGAKVSYGPFGPYLSVPRLMQAGWEKMRGRAGTGGWQVTEPSVNSIGL